MNAGANGRVAAFVALGGLAMLGAAYAAVPLYAAFCRATGYGGTTQRASAAGPLRGERTLEVRFDANVAPGLDWTLEPETLKIALRTGQTATVFFKAHNRSTHDGAAIAAYNVAPDVAGGWFDKISCFCFTEQKLSAGETAEWPVVFFLDPKLEKEHSMDGVASVTLSYTLFASGKGEKPLALAPAAVSPKL